MILRTVFQCYAIDSEMFVGDQRFTEPYIEKYFEEIRELSKKIKNDTSFFCIGFVVRKKGGNGKIAAADAEVDFEDMNDRNIQLFLIFII